MPDSIEAVRADRAGLFESAGDLFFDLPVPTQKTVPTRKSAAAWARSRFSVPRGLIAGTLAATALVWGPYAIIPGQRHIIAWHPLRALNAINVHVFGADLLTVHVQLDTANTAGSRS